MGRLPGGLRGAENLAHLPSSCAWVPRQPRRRSRRCRPSKERRTHPWPCARPRT